jgi:hypothetical protein
MRWSIEQVERSFRIVDHDDFVLQEAVTNEGVHPTTVLGRESAQITGERQNFRIGTRRSRSPGLWLEMPWAARHCRSQTPIVEPDVAGFSYDGFERASELVKAGEQATRAALPEIRKWMATEPAVATVAATATSHPASPQPIELTGD